MSSNVNDPQLDPCGCCDEDAPRTPAPTTNRPGLSALAYRVGTHGRFKAAMLARLSRFRELDRLTTRDNDDAGSALLDGGATVLDVLTFYQERIVNEGFLRTATERRSVQWLARMVGYRLRAGVAAQTYLTFEIEGAPGTPGVATADIGTKAQTIPGPDEKPQIFETVEKIEARAAWNRLIPALRQRFLPAPGTRLVYFVGTNTNLRPGDGLLFIAWPGFLTISEPKWAFHRVREVQLDPDANMTLVTLENQLAYHALQEAKLDSGNDSDIQVFAMRQRASIFGYNAPDWITLPDSTKKSLLGRDPTAADLQYPDFTIFTPAGTPTAVTQTIALAATPEAVAAAVTEAARAAATEAAGKAATAASGAAAAAGRTVTAALTVARETADKVSAAVQTAITSALETAKNSFTALAGLDQVVEDTLQDLVNKAVDVAKGMIPDDFVDQALNGLRNLVGEAKTDSSVGEEKSKTRDAVKEAIANAFASFAPNLAEMTTAVAEATSLDLTGLVSEANAFQSATLNSVRLAIAANGAVAAAESTIAAVRLAMTTLPLLPPPTVDTVEAATRAAVDAAPATALAAISIVGGAAGTLVSTTEPETQAAVNSEVSNVQARILSALENALNPTTQVVTMQAAQGHIPDTIDLDHEYPEVTSQSWVVLNTPAHTQPYQVTRAEGGSRANFMLTGRTTRLTLLGEKLGEWFETKVRETVVFAQSEPLELGTRPITTGIGPGREITLDRRVDDLPPGRIVLLMGRQKGEPSDSALTGEVLTLESTSLTSDGLTRLRFTKSIQGMYQRDSLSIYGNVALATHGETKTEVLGDGDAARPFQHFTLKQSPLTYTQSAAPEGQTTLTVRVNDVSWAEVAALYGRGPRERIYITEQHPDGTTGVRFGDGATGARPPSGQENISATYRVGAGQVGNVTADQIRLLLTRPLGVKGVTNPIAPEGGADPEPSDQARSNAPLTVLTLDRIVSLRDFEDYARSFAGIGKASAVWLWTGERRIVHITVAGPDGQVVAGTTMQNLNTGITGSGVNLQRFRLDPHIPVGFGVGARLVLDSRYVTDTVLADAKNALVAAFSFGQRAFGQSVAASDVIAVLQGVRGVIAVDLEALYIGSSPTLVTPLPAKTAYLGSMGQILGAELLTVDETKIELVAVPRLEP